MKNTALNTLNYTGIVTLSQYVGKTKLQIAQFHNTGNTSLFSFLANCLAGEFDKVKSHTPTLVKVIHHLVGALTLLKTKVNLKLNSKSATKA